MSKEPIRAFRLPSSAGVLAIAGLIGTLVSTAQGAPVSYQETKSQQVFVTVCGRCHPVDRITGMRRTRSQWEETITTMITSRGAQVSDEDFDTILMYLAQEYGRVDINRAPAEDIGEVLWIGDEMAAAIVAYRKQHGPFEDFDALMKVPGLDRGALEKKRDAISF